MRQLTLRVPDDLASRLRDVAALQGRSVNGLATAVLSAAVDPELEGDEAARVRARLERAGLLAEVTPTAGSRPPAERVAAARRRAGTGTPLSDLVAEGRG
jgi:plasmid stability protein